MAQKELDLYLDSSRKVENIGFLNTTKEQDEIISYLSPENPYKSLIVSFEVGTGKTFAAVCLSHLYLLEGYNVLYLSNSITSINNFNNEYINMCRIYKFKEINKIKTLTYAKMNNYNEDLNFGLIILDEAHNLRENGIRFTKILNKLNNAKNIKLLIITATPMVDNIKELNTIYNISESKILFSNKIANDIKINYIGENINGMILFLSEIKGEQLNNYLNIKNDVLYTKSRIALISSNKIYNNKLDLKYQSSKIYKILPTLKEGLTVIFSFYVERGIRFISQVLKNEGYNEWNKNLNNNNTFAIIDGTKSQNEIQEIIKEFNSFNNINGNKIKILIGSSVLKESITIKNVKRLHILSPHWNFSEINQYIGRVIRMNSHLISGINEIDIYLHAAYYDNYKGIDIKMWNIANDKREKINEKLNKEKIENNLNIIKYFECPYPDNKLIIKKDKYIWDLTNCFDKNKYKISWCNIYNENVILYNIDSKIKIFMSLPNFIKIFKPIKKGYTIWRSIVDDKLRLTYISSNEKDNKRGIIINNMKQKYIEKISSDLNCESNLNSIINILKNNNRYIEKQISIESCLMVKK